MDVKKLILILLAVWVFLLALRIIKPEIAEDPLKRIIEENEYSDRTARSFLAQDIAHAMVNYALDHNITCLYVTKKGRNYVIANETLFHDKLACGDDMRKYLPKCKRLIEKSMECISNYTIVNVSSLKCYYLHDDFWGHHWSCYIKISPVFEGKWEYLLKDLPKIIEILNKTVCNRIDYKVFEENYTISISCEYIT